VDKTASKKEILQQVAAAMRSRQYNAKSIAEAQKLLFNSVTRAGEEFKHFLDIERCVVASHPAETAMADAPDLALLDTFDDQAATPRQAD
ncbi:MAG: hypothetical protein OEU26_19475, partial [Candidatus Tectomicrobia bacterium]|nr:hypothetical protein [Candidatus Tectomicrobia bacterium]